MAKCLNQRGDHLRCGYREPSGSPAAIPSPAPKLQIVNFFNEISEIKFKINSTECRNRMKFI